MNEETVRETRERRLFVLGDAPNPICRSGFGHVTGELLARWAPHFARIEHWAINFHGLPLPPETPWPWPKFLFHPAAPHPGPWHSFENLQALLAQLNHEPAGYTHLFVLYDLCVLANYPDFAVKLREVCDARGLRSVLYFPVDAALEPEWTRVLAAFDEAVAYTEYGRREAVAAARELGDAALLRHLDEHLHVLPHGVNAGIYRPLPDRAALRARLFQGALKPDDVLLLNVNQHQPRKHLAGTLELLAELRRQEPAVHWRLLLHCARVDHCGGETDLEVVGRQLGLAAGRDWLHTGDQWRLNNAPLADAGVNELYNAADLLVSTTLGEGWGLSLTEALAAGCPVAAPDHTACAEIMAAAGVPCCPLPPGPAAVVLPRDRSRVRRPVDPARAAAAIRAFPFHDRQRLPPERLADWNWGRVAGGFLRLLEVG